MIEELKGARILVEVCGAVKSGENVVIVTDTNKTQIAESLAGTCYALNANPVIIIMTPRTAHGENPPDSVRNALLSADVVFAVTSYSLFHSEARLAASKSGVRWVNLPDYTNKMLRSGGLFVDFKKQRDIAEKIAAILTDGKEVHVSSAKGTDLIFSIQGRKGIAEGGISDLPGMINSPPDIETCIAPVKGSAQGTIVIDGSIVLPHIGPVLHDVILHVKNGIINEIEQTSEEAIKLHEYLSSYNNPNVYNIAEFGIGLNPACTLSGSMLEDEGVYGTLHFGIGDNHTMGGETIAPTHIDLVLKEGTFYVDKQVIMEKGDLVC